MIGGLIVNNLSLLLVIADRKEEKHYVDLLNKFKVKFKAISYGNGTASSSVLNYFGLNEIERMVIFAIVPKTTSKHILRYANEKMRIYKPGKGIMFTIPLSSSTKYMQEFYKDTELEDIEMKKADKHLIITITNEGYAETVMGAAKKEGATGGTTINGRGLETDKIIKFLGISIEPEKDITMILVDDDKKNDIMDEIIKTCGIKTPGAGICFSIPVDNVEGLIEDINKK